MKTAPIMTATNRTEYGQNAKKSGTDPITTKTYFVEFT